MRRRQHTSGWAYAGSQRHLQAYVNTPPLTALLNAELQKSLPQIFDCTVKWRSPLASAGYAESRDTSFWSAIGHPELDSLAATWWPKRGGPSWDAIALAHGREERVTVVLVEAMANTLEFTSGGCGATHRDSVQLIEAALFRAHGMLGATSATTTWTGSHYKLANRLAWTLWLREQHVDAVFAHVLFADDRSNLPTSGDELTAVARAGHAALGVPESVIDGWCATIVLPALG